MNLLPAITALFCLMMPLIGRKVIRGKSRDAKLVGHPVWVPLGLLILTGNLVRMHLSTGHWPMVTVTGGLQTFAIMVGVGWLFLRSRERMDAAGTILISIVILLVGVSLVDPSRQVTSNSDGPFFSLHLGLIFIGLGTFALSFALSVLFLVQRRRLKLKRLAGIQELPSLDTLDRLNFRTQCFGFVALTVGIAMGFFLAIERGTDRGLNGPTFWGTVAVWVWYAVGLQSWLIGRWKGKPAALFGVVGFSALLVIVALAAVWSGGWHGV